MPEDPFFQIKNKVQKVIILIFFALLFLIITLDIIGRFRICLPF